MLGAEQSGFIADLGYETYQKILEEAVDELKSEEFADLYADNTEGHRDTGSEYVRETYIESDLELMFPPTYIPNDSERISLYRELDNMEEERDILAFTERLKDRFGKIPKEGKELIRIVRLRRMAKKLGMEKVILKKGQMSLFLVNNPDSPYYQSEAFGKLLGFIQKHPRECNLREQNGQAKYRDQERPYGGSGMRLPARDGKNKLNQLLTHPLTNTKRYGKENDYRPF